MKQLLSRVGEVKIEEAVLITAAHNDTTGNELIKVLLDGGREIDLTEEVLEAAIRLLNLGDTLLYLLERAKTIRITEGLLKAAG